VNIKGVLLYAIYDEEICFNPVRAGDTVCEPCGGLEGGARRDGDGESRAFLGARHSGHAAVKPPRSLMKNRKVIVFTGITIITTLIASVFLIFQKKYYHPQRNLFDILMPKDVVEIFFEIKEAVQHHPETKILPNLSSSTKKFLRAEKTDLNGMKLRGEIFSFIHTEASIIYTDYMHDSKRRTQVLFHNPFQSEDKQYVYTLEEELKKILGKPQKKGKTLEPKADISFWQINDGVVLLALNNYSQSITGYIALIFSSEIREPVLLQHDEKDEKTNGDKTND